MRVSACPYPDYDTLNGQVQAISPSAIAAPHFEHLESRRKSKLKPTASTSYKVCVDKTANMLRKNLYDKLPRNHT